MKRLLTLALAVLLLLSGCGGVAGNPPASDPQLISADSLLAKLLAAVPEYDENPVTVSGDELSACLLIYGIDSALVQDCAVARLGGARVFELAVIDLTTPSYTVEDALLAYLRQRQGVFTGYAPTEAEIAANGTLFAVEGDRRLVLALTEDMRAITRTLTETGYTKVTEVSSARQWKDQPTPSQEPEATTTTAPPQPDDTTVSPQPENTFQLPQGWYPYADPKTDNMAVYKNDPILTAWQTGDDSKLLPKNKAIYDRCVEIIDRYITDDMSDYEKEAAIYQWLTWNVAYDWRHQDGFQTTPRESYQPYGALVDGTAVCLGFATSFQLFMDLLDIECITVVGAAFQSSENHAWNMIKLGNEWYCVDATWDMGASRQYWRYFNVTSDHMAKSNHQWDYANIPLATATDHGIDK